MAFKALCALLKKALGVFENKFLRKIFGPLQILDEYRIRYNTDLYELFADIDVIQRIDVQRLRWLGYVVRMYDRSLAKEVFEWNVKVNRRKGRNQNSGGKIKWRRTLSNFKKARRRPHGEVLLKRLSLK